MMRGEALEKSMFFMSDPDWYYYLDEDDDEQFPLLPWTLPPNPQGEKEFTAMRRYSIEMEKPISAFTEEDYYAICIRDLSL